MIKSLLEHWQITEQELTTIVLANPSLRGFMLGYIAEYKLRNWLAHDNRLQILDKPDDHDRKRKNDFSVLYQNRAFSFEVKSLQTHSIQPLAENHYTGKAQVDASDRRPVPLPNGETLTTTCLVVGEFDILALNLFQFREQWDFAFALNRDLPRTTYKRYTPGQQQYLLATLVTVTLPLQSPFVASPLPLLDRLLREQRP
jgi:hypothetical protein